MAAISEFVRTTTYEIASPQTRLPDFMWSILSVLNRVHAVWRWHRRAVLYSNPDNFTQLLGGHVINYVFGESVLLKIAAQSLLIATRLLECTRKQTSLYKEGGKLIAALKGHYPQPIEIAWIEKSYPALVSPSSLYHWKVLSLSLWHRLSRIIHIIYKICLKVFTLSMCIMDTIDAFYISPTTKNEAINACCVNIIEWLDTLVDQKETLLEGICENKVLIEKILSGSPFTYSQIHSTLTSALTTTETLQQHAKKITSFGNGLILKIGHQSLHGLAVVTGVKSLF